MKNLPYKLFRYLIDKDYRYTVQAFRGWHNSLDDATYISRLFAAKMKKTLNLENPQTFNEKLQWLKLHNRIPEYSIMVDKYRVRDYIAKRLGEEYLIPMLGVWDSPEDISFNALPNQFVIKCNHNSGLGMCICKDKSKLDINKVKDELRRGLKQDYYLTGREWPYKDVPRKIIAEQYMIDSAHQELRDYKFFCFNGTCKCMKIDFDRFTFHRANYYTPQGQLMSLGETVCPPDADRKLPMPDNMEKMVALAEQLSSDIPFLRVDFYEVDGRIYFGKLTFYPASGTGTFTDDSWDSILGEWLQLPELECNKQNIA